MNRKENLPIEEGKMFLNLRNLAVSSLLLVSCLTAPVQAAQADAGSAALAIELLEPEPALQAPDAAGEAKESAPGQQESAASPDESAPESAVAESEATAPAQPVPAAAQAVSEESPGFWHKLAHLVGLAGDPTPGETARPGETKPLPAQDYIIGPGDLLGISVWRDESLTRTAVVLADGRVAFPLIGEITAAGKTVAQVKDEIEKKLARFVSDAQLTVEVKQSNSMIIYLIGRVNVPGKQVLFSSTNVLQALAMAGGLNPFAAKSDLKIYRQEGGKTVMYPFDYTEVSEGRHLEANIELKRGDVILVP